jgi:hypothetical protein
MNWFYQGRNLNVFLMKTDELITNKEPFINMFISSNLQITRQ